MTPYWERDGISIYHADCLALTAGVPDASVDLIATDPPYFKYVSEPWDRQWDTPAGFLSWLDSLCQEWRRILRPNGSLYCFASPDMAARVECKIAEYFEVLNRIVWRKQDGTENEGGLWNRANKESLRSYFPQAEYIIFAEQPGTDSMALGESGYGAQCEKLRGFVFEPIRAYLAGEFHRAGVKFDQANEFCSTASMAGRHFFTRSQWCLPTREHYAALRRGLNRVGRQPAPPFAEYHPAGSYWERFHQNGHAVEYLRADYEELRADYEELRADYEELRADYEELRRPFFVTKDRPYTDVWDFATVAAYVGKHPCEKPVALMAHIIQTSTLPGAMVVDPFMGTGATGLACQQLGRRFVGGDAHLPYLDRAAGRLAQLPLALEAL